MADLATAIAPTFTLSAGEDFELAFSSGPSPVTVTMPAGSYRMVLAPTTGSVTDYVRAMTAAINTALVAAGRAEPAIVIVDSTTGLSTISISGAPWSSANEVTGYPLRRLGFDASFSPALDTVTATRPVLYLGLSIERISVGWQTKQIVSGAETITGVTYGIASGVQRADDSITLGFIPRDPTIRAANSIVQTALNPDDAYINSLGVPAAREWSFMDLLRASVGQSCAFALGVFQTVAGDTAARFDVGAIRVRSVADPIIERARDGWNTYYRLTIDVTRTSTSTRA
jgi:hypothetical protein